MPLGLVVIVCLFGSFIRGLNMPHFVSIFAFVSLPIIRRNRLPFWLVYWRAWYASFVLFVFAFVSLPSIRIRYIDCRVRIRVFVTEYSYSLYRLPCSYSRIRYRVFVFVISIAVFVFAYSLPIAIFVSLFYIGVSPSTYLGAWGSDLRVRT